MYLSTDYYIKKLEGSLNKKKIFLKNFWECQEFKFLIKKFLIAFKTDIIVNSLEDDLKIFDLKKKKKIGNLNPFSGTVYDFCEGFRLEILEALDQSLLSWKKKPNKSWKLNLEIILKNPIERITFLPSSNLTITSSMRERKLYLWGNQKKRLNFSGKINLKERISSIEKSDDSKLLALSSPSGKISILSNQGLFVGDFFENGFHQETSNLFFTNLNWLNENILLSGGTTKIILAWDLRMRKKIQAFQGHTGNIINIKGLKRENFNSPFFFSSDTNGVLKLWDIRKPEENFSLKIPYQKIYSSGTSFTQFTQSIS